MDLAASNHRNRSIGCATTCKELFELEGELFSNALVLKQNMFMMTKININTYEITCIEIDAP